MYSSFTQVSWVLCPRSWVEFECHKSLYWNSTHPKNSCTQLKYLVVIVIRGGHSLWFLFHLFGRGFYWTLIGKALVCCTFVFVLKARSLSWNLLYYVENSQRILYHTVYFVKWILVLLFNFNTNTNVPHTRSFPINLGVPSSPKDLNSGVVEDTWSIPSRQMIPRWTIDVLTKVFWTRKIFTLDLVYLHGVYSKRFVSLKFFQTLSIGN
jgi:hypothetical protein